MNEIAQKRGGTVNQDLVFADRALSGAGGDRPEYLRLLQAVHQRRVDVVMVEDLGRVSRDQADLHLLRRTLEYEGIRCARKQIVARIAALGREHEERRRTAGDRVAELEVQAERFVDLVALGQATPKILDRLRAVEAELGLARSKLNEAPDGALKVVRLPTVEEILALALDVTKRFEESDIPRARELLRQFFRDGRIDLVPQPAGFYIARSEVLPLVTLIVTPRAHGKATPPSASREALRFYRSVARACNATLLHRINTEIPAIWVPLAMAV